MSLSHVIYFLVLWRHWTAFESLDVLFPFFAGRRAGSEDRSSLEFRDGRGVGSPKTI